LKITHPSEAHFSLKIRSTAVFRFKPVENFRDEAKALLAKAEANKLIKLCQTESAPRVSFETTERPAVIA
jgi:hypothetical protein